MEVREAVSKDAKELHAAILESTKGLTTIHFDQLRLDLTKIAYHTNRPFLKVIIAKDNGQLLGYIAFYYYFSPWVGHSPYINDIFVKPKDRFDEIATKMFERLKHVCRSESLTRIMFNYDKNHFTGDERVKISSFMEKFHFQPYRTDEDDWSIFKFNL